MPDQETESKRKRRSHRVSPDHKVKFILRVLKGESSDIVADEAGVSVERLERWQETFLAGGCRALEESSERRSRGKSLFKAGSTQIWQWAILLTVLAGTIFFLVRLMNRDTGG